MFHFYKHMFATNVYSVLLLCEKDDNRAIKKYVKYFILRKKKII